MGNQQFSSQVSRNHDNLQSWWTQQDYSTLPVDIHSKTANIWHKTEVWDTAGEAKPLSPSSRIQPK